MIDYYTTYTRGRAAGQRAEQRGLFFFLLTVQLCTFYSRSLDYPYPEKLDLGVRMDYRMGVGGSMYVCMYVACLILNLFVGFIEKKL